MLTRVKQTNWDSDSDRLIELDGRDKAFVHTNRLTAEQLEDLAEAAVEAAQALRLIAETKEHAEAGATH